MWVYSTYYILTQKISVNSRESVASFQQISPIETLWRTNWYVRNRFVPYRYRFIEIVRVNMLWPGKGILLTICPFWIYMDRLIDRAFKSLAWDSYNNNLHAMAKSKVNRAERLVRLTEYQISIDHKRQRASNNLAKCLLFISCFSSNEQQIGNLPSRVSFQSSENGSSCRSYPRCNVNWIGRFESDCQLIIGVIFPAGVLLEHTIYRAFLNKLNRWCLIWFDEPLFINESQYSII